MMVVDPSEACISDAHLIVPLLHPVALLLLLLLLLLLSVCLSVRLPFCCAQFTSQAASAQGNGSGGQGVLGGGGISDSTHSHNLSQEWELAQPSGGNGLGLRGSGGTREACGGDAAFELPRGRLLVSATLLGQLGSLALLLLALRCVRTHADDAAATCVGGHEDVWAVAMVPLAATLLLGAVVRIWAARRAWSVMRSIASEAADVEQVVPASEAAAQHRFVFGACLSWAVMYLGAAAAALYLGLDGWLAGSRGGDEWLVLAMAPLWGAALMRLLLMWHALTPPKRDANQGLGTEQGGGDQGGCCGAGVGACAGRFMLALAQAAWPVVWPALLALRLDGSAGSGFGWGLALLPAWVALALGAVGLLLMVAERLLRTCSCGEKAAAWLLRVAAPPSAWAIPAAALKLLCGAVALLAVAQRLGSMR